ncbi:MAG TPA: PKD domain-containing protein, partial [Phnomibacter sp.]|nr:PKD domain-containing protein [Phnomibacter sp.]
RHCHWPLHIKPLSFISLFLLLTSVISAQQCPPNLDFESGTFDGWRCYTGYVSNQAGVNVFSLAETQGPVDGRHTIIPSNQAGIDPYGGFSTNCPNGSGYSIRLGNDMGGGEGEAISYEFQIPGNRDTFNLLYWYAVVFQDPDHQIYEQPRMEIEILNVTDGNLINCASFTFIPYGTGLPGFFESPNPMSNTPVWCKDWTPVTINLNGNAGKTIRLTFRTGDCTFRRHFGYAYIDVDSDCSGEFVGASFCPQDPEVTVTAPYGFAQYTWFNSDMSRQIGTGQFLTLRPTPPSGTVVNVRLVPYDGFGCPQTLAAKLLDDLEARALAGNDTVSCNMSPVRIGSPPRPGLEYSWSPTNGISNPNAASPIVTPSVTTTYVLTTSSPGGGCSSTDTVTVIASNLANGLEVLGRPQYCIGSGDSAVLQVPQTEVIQWFKNNQLMQGVTGYQYRVTETGTYHAFLRDEYGCQATTPGQLINISSIPVAGFATPTREQCLIGNRFSFTNTSTNQVGTMRYRWDFGGGGGSTSSNPVFSFTAAGDFLVKLIVNTNEVCADSFLIPVTVFQNPVPDFDASAICIGLPFTPLNRTDENIGSPIRYSWDLGTGLSSQAFTPPTQTFERPGNYKITLGVSSERCPLPVQTLTKNLRVESPQTPRRYTTAFAIKDRPVKLEARPIGVKAFWEPSDQLTNAHVF